MLKEIHPIIIPKVLSDKNKTHINKKKHRKLIFVIF